MQKTPRVRKAPTQTKRQLTFVFVNPAEGTPKKQRQIVIESPCGSPPATISPTPSIEQQPDDGKEEGVSTDTSGNADDIDDELFANDDDDDMCADPLSASMPPTSVPMTRRKIASLARRLPPISTQSAIEFFGMPAPLTKYGIIYADPPWTYEVSEGRFGCVHHHYSTMTSADIWKMPVHQLAADNCALLLWATAPKILDAIMTVRYWGFDYKTIHHVWVKTTKEGAPIRNGIGSYARPCAEFLLVGVKGQLKYLKNQALATRVQQLFMGARRGHSRKPIEVIERIETFFLPELQRIELFARERRPGWDAWGNEVEKFLE